MSKEFLKPEIEIVEISKHDIITLSKNDDLSLNTDLHLFGEELPED